MLKNVVDVVVKCFMFGVYPPRGCVVVEEIIFQHMILCMFVVSLRSLSFNGLPYNFLMTSDLFLRAFV